GSAASQWTPRTSSASATRTVAIAAPMPSAVPVTSATLPLSSPTLVPPVLDEVANFRDPGPPELEDLFIGPLVGAPEASIDGQAAQLGGRRLSGDRLRDQRLHPFRHGHPRESRPREVLHP